MLIESHKTHTFALTMPSRPRKRWPVMQELTLTAWSPSGGAAILTSVQGFLACFHSTLPADDIVPCFPLWSVSVLSASSLPMLFNIVYHDCPFQYCVVVQHRAPFRFDNVDGDAEESVVFVTHLVVTLLSALSFYFSSVIVLNSPTSSTCLFPLFLYISLPHPTRLEGSHGLSVHFPLLTESLSQVWQILIAPSDTWLSSRIEYVTLLSLTNFSWMKESASCMGDSESWLMRMLVITEPLITY